MSSSAARTAAHNVSSQHTRTVDPQAAQHPQQHPPANDAAQSNPLPQFILTAALRAEFAAQGATVAPSAIKPLPNYIDARMRWLGGVLASAWADQDLLARIPIGGDAPVTVTEIHRFGYQIEYLRELAIGGAATSPDDPSQLSDAELKTQTRAAQVTLCNAIPLWFAGKTESSVVKARATLRTVKKADADKHLSSNGVKILTIVDEHAKLVPWLHSLPNDEASALTTLRRLHPEHVRREQLAVRESAQPHAVDNHAERAWAMVVVPLQRILMAGRYLATVLPGRRGTYPGFAKPTPASPRKAKVAPTVTQTPAPTQTPAAPTHGNT